MKIHLYITLIFFCLSSTHISQEKEIEDVYIYVNRTSFLKDVIGYTSYFNIESEDENFSHDNYFFKINSPDLENHSLKSLGKPIDLDSVNYIIPTDYFGKKSNCQVHMDLSLMSKNKKRVYVVSQISKGENKKFFYWKATYRGTGKDIIFTNMNGKSLIDN